MIGSRALGYPILILGLLFWAGNAVIGRVSADVDIPPIALNFWRWTTALAIFIPLFGRQALRLWPEFRQHLKFIVFFALLSVVGFNCVFYVGLQHTTALQCSLIQSVLPVLVLLLCFVLLRQPIRGKQWLGVIFSIGGAALIVARGDMQLLTTLELDTGDIWCVAAVIIWAGQAYCMRYKPASIPIMPFMTVISTIAVIAMLPAYLIEAAIVGPVPVNQDSVLMILYVGIFASVLGTTAFNEGTYRIGAVMSGYMSNLYPIFAGGLAMLLLGEDLHWFHVVGTALVLAGIWLATIAQRAMDNAASGKNA